MINERCSAQKTLKVCTLGECGDCQTQTQEPVVKLQRPGCTHRHSWSKFVKGSLTFD